VDRVLEHHRARAGTGVRGEHGRQAGQVRLEHRGDPRGAQGRGLRERAPERVEREGERARVEVRVGQDGRLAGGDQRVLRRRVQLHGEHSIKRGQRISRGALDLRQRAERERILDGRARLRPAPRAGFHGEQLAEAGGDGRLARMRPRPVHALVEHHPVGIRREE
jgi:hypothetical protein